MSPLCAVILTYNEERHIRRCLTRALDFCREIFVIDSFSTDRTPTICRQFSRVHLIQHPWLGTQAHQFNWALNNIETDAEWIIRLDADEYLLQNEGERLLELIQQQPRDIHGILLLRLRYFLGRHIRHGGTDKIPMLRVFRRGSARCEVRAMDEHLVLSRGKSVRSDIFFADNNLAPLSQWFTKHLSYAQREADTCRQELLYPAATPAYLRGIKRRKRLYAHLPLFWRAAALFLYRYFLRLGFLDGKEGFLWHFFQGWWYRTVCDQYIRESEYTP